MIYQYLMGFFENFSEYCHKECFNEIAFVMISKG